MNPYNGEAEPMAGTLIRPEPYPGQSEAPLSVAGSQYNSAFGSARTDDRSYAQPAPTTYAQPAPVPYAAGHSAFSMEDRFNGLNNTDAYQVRGAVGQIAGALRR